MRSMRSMRSRRSSGAVVHYPTLRHLTHWLMLFTPRKLSARPSRAANLGGVTEGDGG